MIDLSRMRSWDWGRIIVAPLFLVLALPSIGVLFALAAQFPAGGVPAAARLINQALAVGFTFLVVLLYFLRSAPSARAKSLPANVLAIAGTFLPLTFGLLPNPSTLYPALIITANFVMLAGLIFSCYALATLGRSFSITPGSRELVQRGPYRLMRHPLYFGECIIFGGAILAAPTALKLTVFLLHTSIQIYRALREEELLAASFPEYADYARRTPAFLPIPRRTRPVESPAAPAAAAQPVGSAT